MKFETTESFLADYKRLDDREKTLFKATVDKMNTAYADFVKSGSAGRPQWPKTLRIKGVKSAPGVWELTWSFSGPDGRATFEYVHVDDEPAIRWRRIGGHAIFEAP